MIFSKRWRTIRRIKKDAVLVARDPGHEEPYAEQSAIAFADSMMSGPWSYRLAAPT